MPRLLFHKTGIAAFMSHLDTMRLFQRAFKRAGLKLTHTQGFNPRPSVSIALPLSVGTSSRCELLDFELEEPAACDAITERLNCVLPAGIGVIDCYENGSKLKNLAYLQVRVRLTYDGGIPDGAADRLSALFNSQSLLVEKKGKNGITQQDIIPMIKWLKLEPGSNMELDLKAMICCQNPTLNPTQLVAAIEDHCPELAPDFASCQRIELYDHTEAIFR